MYVVCETIVQKKIEEKGEKVLISKKASYIKKLDIVDT